MIEQVRQLSTLIRRARRVFLEHPDTTRRRQGVELQRQRLILGRDPGIPEKITHRDGSTRNGASTVHWYFDSVHEFWYSISG